MAKRTSSSSSDPEPLDLDPISEWRALQALAVFFTVMLNHQLRRRWLLEHKCMEDRPISQRFRPVVFFEPIPTLHKAADKYNPYNVEALAALKTRVHLLRGRVEKGKELASEIERRMLDPQITFPTHFCHTCVVGGDEVDVLLTRCGHRVCRTCLSFGVDADGVYECSICFAPTSFVARSPLGPQRSCSVHYSNVAKKLLPQGKKPAMQAWMHPLVGQN